MLLTVKEVSKELHVNPTYVYKLLNAGMLPYMKLGSIKIRREALIQFLEKMEGQDVDQIMEGLKND